MTAFLATHPAIKTLATMFAMYALIFLFAVRLMGPTKGARKNPTSDTTV